MIETDAEIALFLLNNLSEEVWESLHSGFCSACERPRERLQPLIAQIVMAHLKETSQWN